MMIEDRYPKKKILELYLNQINLGSGANGVETASQRYFGKSVRDLNLAEAATLAAISTRAEIRAALSSISPASSTRRSTLFFRPIRIAATTASSMAESSFRRPRTEGWYR